MAARMVRPAHGAAATLVEPAVIAPPLVKHVAPVLALSAPAQPIRAKRRALRVVSLAVEGSLPRSEIERAVARALPALRSCRISDRVIAARFTVDDSRRATDIRTASPCIAQALEHVRTEIAPDMGDASVVLKLGG
jgi:hypothetical protein